MTLEDADRVIYTLMSTMSTSNHEVFNVGDQRTPIVGMYLFKVLKETLTNASLNKLITGKEIFLREPTLPQPIEERVISFNYRSNKFNPNKHLINFVKTNVEAFKDVDVNNYTKSDLEDAKRWRIKIKTESKLPTQAELVTEDDEVDTSSPDPNAESKSQNDTDIMSSRSLNKKYQSSIRKTKSELSSSYQDDFAEDIAKEFRSDMKEYRRDLKDFLTISKIQDEKVEKLINTIKTLFSEDFVTAIQTYVDERDFIMVHQLLNDLSFVESLLKLVSSTKC